MSRSTFQSIAMLLALLASGICYAQQHNKRNILPGGRAAALGGAFTSIADDASASWYNPAGLGFIGNNDISLSANAFTKSTKSIQGAMGGYDIAESSTSLYPGFAGGTTAFSKLRFSYAYFTLDRDNSDESFRYEIPESESSSNFTYTKRQLTSGELLLAGAGAGIALGKNLSFGVSQFYYRRSRQTSFVESAVYDTGATFDASLRQNTLNEGGTTVIGLMLKGTELSLGLSTRLFKPLADNTTIETEQITYTSSAPERTYALSKPRAYDELAPNEYTLGMSWQVARWILLAGDGTYYPALSSEFEDEGGVSSVAAINWSAGIELLLGPLSVRSGYFTNNSLVAKPENTKYGQPEHIDYRGISSGLSWRTKSSDAMLGIVKQRGTGQLQAISGSTQVHDIESESVSYVLTSRYSL